MTSEYHEIPKPERGQRDYADDYYEFVDKVDANLKFSDEIANRPSSEEAPYDAWFEAIDQELIYKNDPENGWIVVGHGNQDNPVPEGHYSSLHTDELNNGGPLSDGDGTERQIWVIANGASDPAGADPEDIILEEES